MGQLNQSTMAIYIPRKQDSGRFRRGCSVQGRAIVSIFERPASAPAAFGIDGPARAGDFQAALLGLVGHDLRQPLQIIQATYDLLRTHVHTEAEQAWLQRGQHAISTLTEQLDRLLQTSRLYEYTKAMEISSVALGPLFWRLYNDNEGAAVRRGINLRARQTGTHVISNPVLLDSILRNLVSNAIKYTEPGGRVLIGCRRFGCDIRIDVYDTGIGIAAERLPRIFDAFERIDSTRCEGLGLGLFVVRRAVELLGHKIEVKSLLAGLVDSLARPVGNATGFMTFEYSLAGKWLELLKQIAPGVTRAAIIRDPTNPRSLSEY
jgi:signal transduction histidine kinase